VFPKESGREEVYVVPFDGNQIFSPDKGHAKGSPLDAPRSTSVASGSASGVRRLSSIEYHPLSCLHRLYPLASLTLLIHLKLPCSSPAGHCHAFRNARECAALQRRFR